MLLYDLKNKNKVEKTHIVRSLFGYKDRSYHGGYTYDRKGLLSKFRFEKIDKSVIIVDRKEEVEVRNILRKFGLNIIVMRLPDKKH